MGTSTVRIAGGRANVIGDTRRIQEEIDAMSANGRGGVVLLESANEIWIHEPLVIRSNVTLDLNRALIRRIPGLFDHMIVTESWLQTATPVTLTYTSGDTVSIEWTAHGKAVGNYVSVMGTGPGVGAPSTFWGTFRVTSVTDANNIVVKLRRVPKEAPSGTWQIKDATVNWAVQNGTLDYNARDGSSYVNLIGQMAIMAFYTHNWEVRDVEFLDVRKYCVFSGNSSNGRVRNLSSAGTLSDGCHFFGPSFNDTVDGVRGYFGDDAVAVSSRDWIGNYVDITQGDVINFKASNVDAHTATAVVQMFSSKGFRMDVEYDNIMGAAPTVLMRVYGDETLGGELDSLKLRRCRGIGNLNILPYLGGSAPVVIQQLILEECTFNTLTDVTKPIDFNANVQINKLMFNDCINNDRYGGTSSIGMLTLRGSVRDIIFNGGSYLFGASGDLTFTGALSAATSATLTAAWTRPTANQLVRFSDDSYRLCVLTNGATTCTWSGAVTASANAVWRQMSFGRMVTWQDNATGVRKITLNNVHCEGMDAVIHKANTVTDNPLVEINGGTFRGITSVFSLSSPADVVTRGAAFESNSGVVRLYNAAAVINHWDYNSGYTNSTRYTATAGSYNPKTFGCQVDVGATGVAKTAGNLAYNIGTGRGTLDQNRHVTCNGTNWVQVDAPTKTF